MAFRCWLCPTEFDKKINLKIHVKMYPHCRLKVVCPLCRSKCTTANGNSDLKRHFAAAHKSSTVKLPDDFFSSNTGYFMALYPQDYKRIFGVADPNSVNAKLAMNLIKLMTISVSKPIKRLEEWEEQWKTAQEPAGAVPDYFEGLSSHDPPQNVPKDLTALPASVRPSNVKKVPEVSTGRRTTSKSSTEPSVVAKKKTKTDITQEQVFVPIENLGTRSWTAKPSNSQAQAPTESEAPDDHTKSTAKRTVVTNAPSSVLTPPTPPVTPTPQAVAASASHSNTEQKKRALDEAATHTATEAKQFIKCATCGRKFSSASSLRIHKRLHSSARRFKCSVCGKRFLYLSSYSVHIIAAHGHDNATNNNKMTDHACSICKDVFPTTEQLEKHTAVIHGEQATDIMKQEGKAFKCDKCILSFAEKKTLAAHRVTHAIAKFPCPLCGKHFTRISSVKCHTMKKHKKTLKQLADEGVLKAKLLLKVKISVPRPAICRICGHHFETYERLSKHVEKHKHNHSRGIIDSPCPHCNKVFEQKTQLDEHIQRDHGISSASQTVEETHKGLRHSERRRKPMTKPTGKLLVVYSKMDKGQALVCDFCGAQFAHRRTLTRHIKTHLGVADNSQLTLNSKSMSENNSKSGVTYINTVPFRLRPGYGKLGIHNHMVNNECFEETLNNTENGTILYKCKICCVNFFRQSELVKHIQDKVDYHCKNYSKRISDIIYTNFNSTQRKIYKPCEFCGIFYTTRSSMCNHRIKQHGDLLNNGNRKSMRAEQSDGTIEPLSESPIIEVVRDDEQEALPNGAIVDQYQDEYFSEINNVVNGSDIVSTTFEVPISDSQENSVSVTGVGQSSYETAPTHREELNVHARSTSINAITSSTSDAVHYHAAEATTKMHEYDYVFETDGNANVNLGLNQSSTITTFPKVEPQSQPQADLIISNYQGSVATLHARAETSTRDTDQEDVSMASQGDNQSINSELPTDISNTVIQSSSSGSGDFVRKVEVENPIDAFEDSEHNDLNSSDEESLFGDDETTGNGELVDMPVGDNPTCMQCQSPFAERQVSATCHLCCKRFCLQCSRISKSVYKRAFLRRSTGLVWMCPVCKPAFPGYMALLRQLAEFEETLNKRLTGVSQRINNIESNVNP